MASYATVCRQFVCCACHVHACIVYTQMTSYDSFIIFLLTVNSLWNLLTDYNRSKLFRLQSASQTRENAGCSYAREWRLSLQKQTNMLTDAVPLPIQYLAHIFLDTSVMTTTPI